MKVLVTGGNDELRRSITRALISRAHDVRLAAGASSDIDGEWPARVELWRGDPLDRASLRQAASGCDAAIVVGQLAGGTSALADANRVNRWIESTAAAGVRRVLHVRSSSIRNEQPSTGPQGRTDELVRRHPEWLEIRTSVIYGIADDPISRFFIMMRSLPAVPMLSDTYSVHPLWHEDLARALAAAVELEAAAGNRALVVRGPEAVTHRVLYDRIAALIDRRPARLPLPDFLLEHGARLAKAFAEPGPHAADALRFAAEAADSGADAESLSRVFGVTATTLDEGLTRLATGLSELTPADGTGTVELKRFFADIRNSRYDAPQLLREFRARFKSLMPVPIGVEPASPETELNAGAAVTIALPGRGHVQVRVEEVETDHVTIATLRGHALAGVVRFNAHQNADVVRFEIVTCDAAANALDWVGLTLGGARLQDANWTKVVQNVVDLSGGSGGDVASELSNVTGAERDELVDWARRVIQRRRADENRELLRAQGS